MKKIIVLIAIVILSSFSFCYSQENEDIEEEYIFADSDRYSGNQLIPSRSVRFGTGMPEHEVTTSRIATEEEYIFKTYIIEKLLKSNRILY